MNWVFPHGTLDQGVPRGSVFTDWQVSVTDRLNGWRHTTLRVTSMVPSGRASLVADGEEVVVVPLTGSYEVSVRQLGATRSPRIFELAGRESVFTGPTDVLYVPSGHELTITCSSGGPGRVAVCGAYVTDSEGRGIMSVRDLDPIHVASADVPVEFRGAGHCSREVRNFGVPGVLDAERIIACEVVTPAGNWSSYPPHKHDEERPGEETQLEEIYYHEVQVEGGVARDGTDPHGFLRVYGSGSGGEIDVLTAVRTGDVVLVPFGWHGPAMAVPGYDLYYLNVMAGPSHEGAERAWLITDDPAHGWVRETWTMQDVDPRLPLGGAR